MKRLLGIPASLLLETMFITQVVAEEVEAPLDLNCLPKRTLICTARLGIVVHMFEWCELDPELLFRIWVRRRFDQRCIGLG
jgi:hypothetical protein